MMMANGWLFAFRGRGAGKTGESETFGEREGGRYYFCSLGNQNSFP